VLPKNPGSSFNVADRPRTTLGARDTAVITSVSLVACA